MNKISSIFSLFVFAIVYSTAAYAEINIVIKNANYPVDGVNIEQIRQALVVSGLKDIHGNVFAAKTSTKFTWKYQFAELKTGCSIKSANIEVQITYQLPELANDNSLSANDQAEWARYYAATSEHEQGHANISIETAKEMEKVAVNIPPKVSCGESARTANMLISNILSRHEHNHVDYDTHTAHGVSQGAVFAAR